jgi:acetyl-CoA carboxylase carboxyl transferase subunit alpha
MLENAVYSVISPESCAAIIYRDSGKAEQAAEALRLTAEDLHGLGLIDGIVPEPPGGAQADHAKQAAILDEHLAGALDDLRSVAPSERVEARYQKFRRMGTFGQAKFF